MKDQLRIFFKVIFGLLQNIIYTCDSSNILFYLSANAHEHFESMEIPYDQNSPDAFQEFFLHLKAWLTQKI